MTSTRRPPPPFRPVTVAAVERPTPRLAKVVLAGDALGELDPPEPAASLRLFLPPADALVLPTWAGNEFLMPDGTRPVIRTLTPRRFDPPNLEVWIVIHGPGAASRWAATARPGARAAVSGFARGYPIDENAPAFLVAGDETALAAVSQLLELLPSRAAVEVHLEVVDPAVRLDIGGHPRAAVFWHVSGPDDPPGEALVRAVRAADIPPGARVWAAGEAAAMQRIRRHLFEERGIQRERTWVRGYWKHGRAGDTADT